MADQVDIVALKTFMVSDDGISSREIAKDASGKVPADAVEGLIAGGYVKLPGGRGKKASSDAPVEPAGA